MSSIAEISSQLHNYHNLSPDRILNAFEDSTGLLASGRITALNSLENRVFEIELENTALDTPYSLASADNFRIIKFYRPGRWSKEQILQEHRFLLTAKQADITVVAPLILQTGSSLATLSDENIHFALFPKFSGRNPQEFSPEQAQCFGRTLARLHQVGKSEKAAARKILSPQTYGLDNLHYLLENQFIPKEHQQGYQQAVVSICEMSVAWFAKTPLQRIHGDCHLGNIIEREAQLYLLDFDDMLQGPCIQDLWLVMPDRDYQQSPLWQAIIAGYEEFADFPYSSIKLIEALRALRYIHFDAWIAKRYAEPSFQQAFPHFQHPNYWSEQIAELQRQASLLEAQQHCI